MKYTDKRFAAGTLESSDVMVTVEYQEGENRIDIDSVVQEQFGDSIRHTVEEVLAELAVRNAKITVVDRGALDCVIRARVETAVMRGRKGE